MYLFQMVLDIFCGGCFAVGSDETAASRGCFRDETTASKLIDCRACCSYKEDVAVYAVGLVISEGFIVVGLKSIVSVKVHS